jgi:hypothetical protein
VIIPHRREIIALGFAPDKARRATTGNKKRPAEAVPRLRASLRGKHNSVISARGTCGFGAEDQQNQKRGEVRD